LDSRPEHIKEVADASLKRLKTESSIFCISTASTRRANRGCAGTVKDLIQAGKVKHFAF